MEVFNYVCTYCIMIIWVRENGLMEDELMDGSVISMLHPMIQLCFFICKSCLAFTNEETVFS